jgi:N-methylhydantoinase B
MVTGLRRDPITFELIKNAVASIADEMAVTMVRTARSFVLKEAMDFSTALLNARGEMIAQGLCLPLHMGSIPAAMRAVLKKFAGRIEPGDLYALNDPYEGGSHLPDVYIFKPIFAAEQLLGFAATIGHQADIGGRVAGGNACDSTEIFQEGLRIPPLKLFDRGQRNDALFAMIDKNVRIPSKVLGDIMAQVAACRAGEQEFLRLAERYGRRELDAYLDELLDYTERLTRSEIAALPDGAYCFTDYIDDDGIDPDPIRIQVQLTVDGERMAADFGGTSPQVKGAINAVRSFTESCVYACVRAILDPGIPNNEGYFRPLTIRTEPGSFVDCVPPAPVAARGLAAMRITQTVYGALAQMLPQRVFACEVAGDTGVTIAGYHADRTPFVYLEFLFGSWGGGPDKDGLDANAPLAINYSNTPVECIETEQPIMIERYGYVPDTGGAGEHRGGLALERQYKFLAPEGILQLRSDRRKFLPYGLQGGKPGTPSQNILIRQAVSRELPSKFLETLKQGDVFRHVLAGAGGWGDPLARDPQRVAADVRNGKLSEAYVRREYGVIIDPRTGGPEAQATERLRQRMRQERRGVSEEVSRRQRGGEV